ncbi:hypothetical protein [Aphanothece hegewaldii]|nr:hypothetical protein [Aphanothece hegewaldii]
MLTREDLQREYDLSEEDFKETLKACGLSLKKRNYSEAERERFAQARMLFDEGIANSYDDLASHFKSQDFDDEDDANAVAISVELAEHLRLLEQQAVDTGFQMGLQQAEIMGKVIPQVTIMRLKEMIATGELRQNFEQFWQEASPQLGNVEALGERVESRWKEYQLQKYQPLTSLPESSMESSSNDF